MRPIHRVKVIFLMVSVLIVASCELLDKSDPRKLLLVNNSDQNIIFYMSYVYDSSGIDLTSAYNRSQMRAIDAGKRTEYSSRSPWEKVQERYTENEFIIFVVNRDSVVKYAQTEPLYPQSSSGILKSWTLNLDSLKAQNWTIAFP